MPGRIHAVILENNLSAKRAILPSHYVWAQSFAWISIVIGCFVLIHPYNGIVHDGLLYLAQAFRRLHPDIYAGDAFFQWGSQDQYTLFSPVYSALIVRLGLFHTNVLLVLLSQALFLAASFALVRALMPPGLRGFAMLFIACSFGGYGGRFIFHMAEPFVTPRPLVEAATLFAVLLLISGRRVWALAPLAASALLHPLVAIAGMLYWWVYQLLEDRRWCWLLALGAIPVAAGLAGIAPFTQLFQSFDPTWLLILHADNAFMFTSQWTFLDWGMITFDAVVLLIAASFAEGAANRVFKAALVTAVAVLGATFVAADLLHNVLLTGLQPWRALWIAHWMAAMALPFAVSRLWNAGAAARLVAALLVYGFITRGYSTSFAASAVALALFHFGNRAAVSPWIERVVLFALAVGALVNWGNIALNLHRLDLTDSFNPAMDFALGALSKPLPLLLFATAITWFGLRSKRSAHLAAMLAAVFLLLTALVWDQRTPYFAYLESATMDSHPFSRFVQPHQQVLWFGSMEAPWLLMHRRNYSSHAQRAGQGFNRETAMELYRRGRAIAILEVQEKICRTLNGLNNDDACEPDAETVTQVCREAGNLDFIVLQTRIANKWLASWTFPAKPADRLPHNYLYECKAFA